MRDLASDITFQTAFGLTFIVADTLGVTTDRRRFKSVIFVGDSVALAGGSSIAVEHSDDGTAWSRIPHAELQGRNPIYTADDGIVSTITSSVRQPFYVGTTSKKRYFRIVFTGAASLAGFPGAFIVLADPIDHPVIQDPGL